LDNVYGLERTDEGGVILIAETIEAIAEIADLYFPIDNNRHEVVDIIKCKDCDYLNIMYVNNNEHTTTVIIPKSIAPKIILNEIEGV